MYYSYNFSLKNILNDIKIKGKLTINGHPEYKQGHTMELPAPADTEPKSPVAPGQLDSKVLILFT